MKALLVIISFVLFSLTSAEIEDNEIDDCDINLNFQDEIRAYQPIANQIIHALTTGKYRRSTYNQLATFIDKFGPRFTGTQNLEDAIDYMLDLSVQENLDNVRFENVTVPQWVRGEESATLIKPRRQNLRMLGLGYSVGTPENGIQAEAIVVKDFKELQENGHLIKGKIVVYDQKYVAYGQTVQYRVSGASEAAKLGAVATLINSITPYSLNTPHTGEQTYYPNVPKIPTACITAQDAHMLRRMQNRGDKLIINMKMRAQMLAPKVSRNTIAEIRGSEAPEKVVLVSGHLDSWDIGQGAMDDGGGAFVSWNSLVVLRALGLRPRRTLRAVLWTAEEMGLIGAKSYVKDHKHEMENFNFVMESDEGTFLPTGLGIDGTDQAICIVREVLNLMSPINATYFKIGSDGPDIGEFINLGVPGASLLTTNKEYFVFHHTEADTMDVENPTNLDLATALWATVSFVIADLSFDLPKIIED